MPSSNCLSKECSSASGASARVSVESSRRTGAREELVISRCPCTARSTSVAVTSIGSTRSSAMVPTWPGRTSSTNRVWSARRRWGSPAGLGDLVAPLCIDRLRAAEHEQTQAPSASRPRARASCSGSAEKARSMPSSGSDLLVAGDGAGREADVHRDDLALTARGPFVVGRDPGASLGAGGGDVTRNVAVGGTVVALDVGELGRDLHGGWRDQRPARDNPGSRPRRRASSPPSIATMRR